jgi:predicted ATP-grasp superfamily ATP-dependent carboligase
VGNASPSAFILGLAENGYGILRGLAREGVRAAGCHSEAGEFGRYSRYCETLRVPSVLDEEQFCRALIEWRGDAGGRPVLFPTSDRYASLLARNAERLAAHFRFHWVHADNMERIVDKAGMSAACHDAGVLAPRTHIVGPDEDLVRLAGELAFPCLVKPNRDFDNPFPARLKTFIARSPGEFLGFFRQHPRLRGATVCQQIIEGGDENIFQCTVLVCRSGEVGAVFCARKLRQYRPGYGVMCFGRSEANEVLAAHALRLLRALRYRGLASLEFKYCTNDGCYYFIEMNPRLPWYNALCVDAGVNLPYLAYLDLAETRLPRPVRARQRDGVYWISFKLDLGWFLLSRIAGRARLLAWLRSLARARSFAWFDWRDPRPFLRATAHILSLGVRQSLNGRLGSSPRTPRAPVARSVWPPGGPI